MIYLLRLPGWSPIRTNAYEGHHWATKKRLRDAQDLRLLIASRNLDIPLATGKRRVSWTVRAERGRLPDPDAYTKRLLDSLVRIGLLKDDSAKWCELGPIVVERGEKITLITLEDLW